MKVICVAAFLITLISCVSSEEKDVVTRFRQYIQAWNDHAFMSGEYRDFVNDTIYLWHGKKHGQGIESVYNPFSKWKQWDVAMNGTYEVDSIVYTRAENKLIAHFRESNDFLKEIGMPEGFSAVVHYWFDDSSRVKEILYEWSRKNKDFKTQLKPVVDWAIKNDSLEIAELYLKNGFEPSWTNAIRWKRLIAKYRK